MRVSRSIFVAVMLLITCAANTTAQETTQPGNRVQPVVTLPDYVVEVRRPDGCVVAPISPKSNRGVVLYALPRPPKVVPDLVDHHITSKVVVSVEQKGALWEVKVSIGKGEFYDAGDIIVGEFKLNLNQRVSVNDFSRFGLSPIQVGVVKIVRQEALKPTFESLIPSVSLESVEATTLPDPFKLKLKNDSGSDLIGIQYHNFKEHRFVAMKWLSQGINKPLIKAGDSYTLEIGSEDKSCGDNEGYRPNQLDQIHLVSAVFADGTYEGLPGLAALIKGAALGNHNVLERVVEVIRQTTDATELSQQLRALHDGMSDEADPYLVEVLRNIVQTLPADAIPALPGFIRSGMHEVKVSLNRDAENLRLVGERGNSELNKKWVDAIKKKYERWGVAAAKITERYSEQR